MQMFMNIVPALGVLGLLFAAYLAAKVSRQEPGTDRMKEISSAISEGARAFLFSEYKILVIFVAVLFVLIGIGIGNWVTAVCFVVGALFSTLAGYCGMTVATKANVRTANAARLQGMNKALSIAFSGGAVMGMCVAGFGVLGVSGVYLLTGNVDVLSGSVWALHPSLCLPVWEAESIQKPPMWAPTLSERSRQVFRRTIRETRLLLLIT